MTIEQLEHAIRAACEVAQDTEVWVFGSQAILATYPDAPVSLRRSVEVDVQPKNRPDQIDRVDGALGELSQFHETHGFYVHGVPIENVELPDGWRDRTVKISNPNTLDNTGYCLEAHDLAASKLAAFRQRDLDFVRILLVERLLDPETLIVRTRALPVHSEKQERLATWVSITQQDLD